VQQQIQWILVTNQHFQSSRIKEATERKKERKKERKERKKERKPEMSVLTAVLE